MEQQSIRIIGISGSLRSNSSASAVLEAVAGIVPENVKFEIFSGLAEIPPFNDSKEVPLAVTHFIELITEADGVLFCIPEYAFGVPGVLKNALDWTVSSTAFYNKPVALITAASSGDKAHAALTLTLTALSTKISAATSLLISFIRTKLDEKNNIKDITTLNAVTKLVRNLIRTIVTNQADAKQNEIYFLRETLQVADMSHQKGNLPFGCILVDADGNIIEEGENRVVTDSNPIAHCEIVLVNKLSNKYQEEFLQSCTVYASTEPCAMCAAAIFWSGIGRLVFALGKEKFHEIARTINPGHILEISAEEVLSKGGRKVKVEGPLLEEEAVDFYRTVYT